MLVLTRKSSETILIGDDIVVKVLKTGKGAIKIGIEAPRSIRVLRGELCEADFPAKVEQTIEFPEEAYSETAVACSDQFPQPHVA
jgi:carbon storage regulator